LLLLGPFYVSINGRPWMQMSRVAAGRCVVATATARLRRGDRESRAWDYKPSMFLSRDHNTSLDRARLSV